MLGVIRRESSLALGVQQNLSLPRDVIEINRSKGA
jgi:hypothetical protein